MRASVNIALRLLLLISACVSVLPQSSDEEDDDLAQIANSGTETENNDIASADAAKDRNAITETDGICAPIELSAEKKELLETIENLLSPTEQEKKQLTEAINSFTSDDPISKQTEPTKYVPQADPKAKKCGEDMECVELWRCNSTQKDNGRYKVQFRSLYTYPDCYLTQTCCRISDKIPYDNPPPMQDMLQCGHRNENGVLMKTEGARKGEAEFGEFPWIVAIMQDEISDDILFRKLIGGGSILSPNIILTAGHKVNNRSIESLVVRAGEWDRTDTTEIYSHEDVGVQTVIFHQNYSLWENNIALLVLKKSFEAKPHIYPICLPNTDQKLDLDNCFTMGWGKFIETPTYPNILKKIQLGIVPRDECIPKIKKYVLNVPYFHESYICAGGKLNVDACEGDGGAPLVCPLRGSANLYYQVGIVAWGGGCGIEGLPAAYTDVTLLTPWITSELNKLSINAKYYTAVAQ